MSEVALLLAALAIVAVFMCAAVLVALWDAGFARWIRWAWLFITMCWLFVAGAWVWLLTR